MPTLKFHQIVILAATGLFLTISGAYADVSFPKSTVKIITPQAKHKVMVEVATSPEQLQQGLMFRKTLADNAGMLFVFPKPGEVTMWMENTLVPLDMLFIDEQGFIKTIRENAVPLSEEYIFSHHPVKMVLELKAGSVKKWGIHENDKVLYEKSSR